MPPSNYQSLSPRQKLIFKQLLHYDWVIEGNVLTLKLDETRLQAGAEPARHYMDELAAQRQKISALFQKYGFDPDYWLGTKIQAHFSQTDWKRYDIPLPFIEIHQENGQDVNFWFSQHLFKLLHQQGRDPAAHLR